MRTIFNHNSVFFVAIMVTSFLFLSSCEGEITSYLEAPAWIDVEEVSSTRLYLCWEPVKGAKQYVIYKVFLPYDYDECRNMGEIETYAFLYEVARTTAPEYQYQDSYVPVENGYSSYYYFGVRVVDKNGNMSRFTVDHHVLRYN